MELSDVRAVVTGAASGLGFRFAVELARVGAKVAAGDVNTEGLRRLAAETAGLPGTVFTAALDVGQEPSVKGFVEEARAQLGHVNTLVNNAGVLHDGLLVKEEAGWVKRLPTAQWKRVLDVNLTGAFLVAREVAAGMLEHGAGGGCIVNISSLSRLGNEGQSSYSASKAGMDAITRTWALELAPYGIRVAGIAPGVIRTPILDHISPEAQERLLAEIPLRRFGAPEEVWLALKFILECEFFNGSILEVDGGAGIR